MTIPRLLITAFLFVQISCAKREETDSVPDRNGHANAKGTGCILIQPDAMLEIFYTMKSDDRLIDIANQYDTTVEKIMKRNRITSEDKAIPGIVLIVPNNRKSGKK